MLKTIKTIYWRNMMVKTCRCVRVLHVTVKGWAGRGVVKTITGSYSIIVTRNCHQIPPPPPPLLNDNKCWMDFLHTFHTIIIYCLVLFWLKFQGYFIVKQENSA